MSNGSRELSRAGWGVVVALIVLGCGQKATAPVPEPIGTVSTANLNFGYVAATQLSPVLSFTIKNDGGGTLRGAVAEQSADFQLTLGEGGYELKAGEIRTVYVQFCPQTEGAKACTVSTGVGSGVVCSGNGDPAPRCSVSPGSLDFGTVTVGYSATRSFTIRNTGGGTLSGTVSGGSSAYSSPSLPAGSYSYSLGPADSATFRVNFAPNAGGGPQTASFDVGHGQSVSCTGVGRVAPKPTYVTTFDGFQNMRDCTMKGDTLLVLANGGVHALSPLGALLFSWDCGVARTLCIERTGAVLVAGGDGSVNRYSISGSFLGVVVPPAVGYWPGVWAAATDATGNIYLCEESGWAGVVKYSSAGVYLGAWGSVGDGDGQFRSPRDICVTPDGRVLVLDTRNALQVFTQDGVFLSRIGEIGEDPSQFNVPMKLAYMPDGRILVLDGGDQQVMLFDSDGSFILDFAGPGSGPGQFADVPEAIAVSADFRIYVADRSNQISKFVATGAAASVGRRASGGPRNR